jgi:hypothetical protein
VDFLSHDLGPSRKKVRDYLQRLDTLLARPFAVLRAAERARKRDVLAMLSADHGFDVDVKKTVHLEEVVKKLDPEIVTLEEGRYLGIYFPTAWSLQMKKSLQESLIRISDVDFVGLKIEESFQAQSRKLSLKVSTRTSEECGKNKFALSIEDLGQPVILAKGPTWMCPDGLDEESNRLFYPYLLSNLAHYFRSSSAPEMVVVAKPGVAFNSKYKGQHGGPTEREVIVPLLIRNAKLKNPDAVVPLWDVLNYL